MEELKLLAATKESLHKDIEDLGIQLEAIQKETAEAQAKSFDIAALHTQIEALTPVRDELLAASKERDEAIEKKNILTQEIMENTKTLADMALNLQKAEDLADTISLKESDLTAIEEKIEEQTGVLAGIIEKIKDNTLQNDALYPEHNARVEVLSVRFDAITANKQEEIAVLDSKISDLKIEQGVVEDETTTKKSNLADLNVKIIDTENKLNGLDAEYTEKKATKEKEVAALSATVDTHQADLEKREGDLSLKEVGLERKRAQLVAVKTRIEVQSGQSINIEI